VALPQHILYETNHVVKLDRCMTGDVCTLSMLNLFYCVIMC